MSKNNMKIIKTLGALFIVTGLLQVVCGAEGIWWSLRSLLNPSSFVSIQKYLIFGVTSIFFLLLIPSATLIAGYGLVRVKKWSWILALSLCVITFVLSCYGSIKFAIASYTHRNMLMPQIPEEAHVETARMWSSYIKLLVSALLILVLKRETLREEFNTK
jgi:hypothetical protein